MLLLQVDQRCQDDEKPLGNGTTPDSAMSKVKPSLLETMHGFRFAVLWCRLASTKCQLPAVDTFVAK